MRKRKDENEEMLLKSRDYIGAGLRAVASPMALRGPSRSTSNSSTTSYSSRCMAMEKSDNRSLEMTRTKAERRCTSTRK
jgi:hypothetical protein